MALPSLTQCPPCDALARPEYPKAVDPPHGLESHVPVPIVRMHGQQIDLPHGSYLPWKWIEPIRVTYNHINGAFSIGHSSINLHSIVWAIADTHPVIKADDSEITIESDVCPGSPFVLAQGRDGPELRFQVNGKWYVVYAQEIVL